MSTLYVTVFLFCFCSIEALSIRNITFITIDDNESTQKPPVNSDNTNLDTLRLVQLVFRHGNRSPIVQFPLDPNQNESLWPEGFSSLLKAGKLRHYNFGKYLRNRYDGFLSDAYAPSEIFVSSSDADRAIMSVLSNLAGLFPPTPNDPKSQWNSEIHWQPIPVHTIPKSLDNFINFKAVCPRFKELKEEYIQRSPFAKEINEAHTELFNYLSEHTGLNVTDFEIVSDLWDTLHIQYSNNLTLPDWTKQVFPEKLEALAPIPFDTRVQVPTKEAQIVKCGPLLKRLVDNMDKRIKLTKNGEPYGAGQAKMYMFSGHDSTSSILLGTLNAFDAQFPSFASAVIMELHELPIDSSSESNQGIKTDFFLKLFFRNETTVPPYELMVPKCGYPCPLDKLKDLYSDVMVDDDQWKEACKAKE